MTITVQTARTASAASPPLLGSPDPGWPDACTPCPLGDAIGVTEDDLARQVRGVAGLDGEARGSGADFAASLWSRCLRFDAADPGWPDRDRFVVSPGHGAAVLGALLQLTGSAQGAEAGGCEGFAAAVGMALAERFLAARFGRTLVDHRTWLLASDADLMQGVSHEVASLAGQLQLDRLTVLWDAAHAPAETLRRFAAYGWATRTISSRGAAELAAGIGAATRSRKPVLLCLSPEAAAAASPQLASAADAPVLARWRAAGLRGAAARRSWLKRLAHHPRRVEFERAQAGLLPETLGAALQTVKASLATAGPVAPQEASRRVLAALQAALPDLVGGAAEPAGGLARPVHGQGGFASRFLHFGNREHGMAAAMVGMAAHGGVLPYAGVHATMSEAIRPALRLAAVMRQRVVHVLTHPSPAAAAASRPVEPLAGLRAVPNLHVMRPADAVETAECWELALRRDDGPSLLLLDSLPAPVLRGSAPASGNRCAEGGYVLAEAEGPRRATLIATGAEVALALAARARLAAERIAVAVVSLPCWDLFARAEATHRARVLGEAMRFGIEAGSSFGWERWLGADGVFIGCDEMADCCDLSPETIAATVRRCLAA